MKTSMHALNAETNASFETSDSSGVRVAHIDPLLDFSAPYLIDKLCNLGFVEDASQGEALFLEVKRYLQLSATRDDRPVPVYSARIDEVWHQFILFTAEYQSFCERFAGRYLHHSPRESDAGAADGANGSAPPLSFEEFQAVYTQRHGALSPLWYDELWLTERTRLAHASGLGRLSVRAEDSRAVLIRDGDAPRVLCRVDARASSALRLIAREKQFLIRELPDLASNEERIALCRPLVKFRILRLAL